MRPTLLLCGGVHQIARARYMVALQTLPGVMVGDTTIYLYDRLFILAIEQAEPLG